jgi:helix-turn-helix protein
MSHTTSSVRRQAKSPANTKAKPVFDGFDVLAWHRSILDSDCLLDKHETLVVLVLVKHAHAVTGTCFPSIATIAKESKVAKSTVELSLAVLRNRGIIRVEHQHRGKAFKSNNYSLTLQPPLAALHGKEPGSPGVPEVALVCPAGDTGVSRGAGGGSPPGGWGVPRQAVANYSSELQKETKENAPLFSSKAEETETKPEPATEREDVKRVFAYFKKTFNHPELVLRPEDAEAIAGAIALAVDGKGEQVCKQVARYLALDGRTCDSPAEIYSKDAFPTMYREANRIADERTPKAA